MLAGVATAWGITFTVVDDVIGALPPADVVAWRFGLAALLLAAIGRGPAWRLPPQLRRRAGGLGLLLGGGFLLQTWGLTDTDASTSGLLTSLLVVVAPLTGWALFRDRVSALTGAGIASAAGGVALLGFRASGFGPGEALTMAAACLWGLHVVLLSRWAEPRHALALARWQIAIVGLMAGVVVFGDSFSTGRTASIAMPPDALVWSAVGFLAVVASAAATVALTWAQARLSATRSAAILTLEPATAALTAAACGAGLGLRTVGGGILIILALLTIGRGQRVGRPTGVDTPAGPALGSAGSTAPALSAGSPGSTELAA